MRSLPFVLFIILSFIIHMILLFFPFPLHHFMSSSKKDHISIVGLYIGEKKIVKKEPAIVKGESVENTITEKKSRLLNNKRKKKRVFVNNKKRIKISHSEDKGKIESSTNLNKNKAITRETSAKSGNFEDEVRVNGITKINTDNYEKEALINAYINYIFITLKKNIYYPNIALKRGIEGTVYIDFMVTESGEIKDITISKSSGFNILDKTAVEIVKKSSPLKPPPEKMKITAPIIFSIKN